MATPEATDSGRTGVRVNVSGRGEANASTGLPVLDHLLSLLADRAGFDLAIEVAPDAAESEAAAAGRALGEALSGPLRVGEPQGYGTASCVAGEALAHVVLEASEQPLLVSNVDLTGARIGGLESDLISRFLQQLAEGAGLTLHVRLVEGRDTQHVLEAIFKALGIALAEACAPRGGS
ncbi:MAG: imidazoleglycerol-phosphate dehydratase [Gaiellaceae bacterium]|jgi:imidazoleglycerol-phosphate dehydratase|nr:imidazoleglycerol-phosphate dehydratase [Gaiellaceae bacterium]